LFKQISIVGLGLIGGSLGLALRKGKIARKVIGFSRHEATIRRAIARGAIDDGDTELCPDWLGHSDLVVIATPPLAVAATARRIAKITSGRIFLTDVASTKSEIVKELERSLPSRISFVGAHPMAGSERSGIDAADPALFRDAVCVITPTPRTNSAARARVSLLWHGVSSRVVSMPAARHDALVAQISHLPHLTAAALTRAPDPAALALAAGGFADATRIAAGDPALWEEICRTNRREILSALVRLQRELNQLKKLLRGGRSRELRQFLAAAQRRRLQLGR